MSIDLHKRWTHRWITSKVESYSSPSHGLGTIAKVDIKKGEDVLVYGGVVIHKSEMKEYWDVMGHVGTQIDDNFFICPTSREELESSGVINHSCNPSVGFKNQIQLMAIRDVKIGEEIAIDYSFCESSYPMNFKCECGEDSCRGVVTNDDWGVKDLQDKYGKYFSPYLKAKISLEQ